MDFGHLNYEVPRRTSAEKIDTSGGIGNDDFRHLGYAINNAALNRPSETHYNAKFQNYELSPVTEVELWNENRNRPHGKIDGRGKRAVPSERKMERRPRVPELSMFKLRFPGEPWKAQAAQAWLKKCNECHLAEAYDWLNGKSEECELKRVLSSPLVSHQSELEIMTRNRDFEIDPEWRKQPWMINYPKKNLI